MRYSRNPTSRKSQFAIEYQLNGQSRSLPVLGIGCFLLPIGCLIFAAGAVFLLFKYYSILLSIASTRLHLPAKALIAIALAQFVVSIFFRGGNLPIYKIRPKVYLGVNFIGAIIPVAIALYQFRYAPPLAIGLVSLVVTTISYFSIMAIPLVAIATPKKRLWLIVLLTALSAGLAVDASPDRLDVSVAFAGGVLGTLIGADLLHLKDIEVKAFLFSGNIGGGRSQDGIFLVGILSMAVAEFWPSVLGFLTKTLGLEAHTDGLGFLMIGGAIAVLIHDIITKRKALKQTSERLTEGMRLLKQAIDFLARNPPSANHHHGTAQQANARPKTNPNTKANSKSKK